jgi:hypothetical protein
MTAGFSVLKVDVVAADYFLLRVKEYERRYKMDWGDFLAKYASGQVDKERTNRDFAEWAFLCKTFSSELIQIEAESPPGGISNATSEKPENISGFCFDAHRTCLRLRNTSRRLTSFWRRVARLQSA